MSLDPTVIIELNYFRTERYRRENYFLVLVPRFSGSGINFMYNRLVRYRNGIWDPGSVKPNYS